MNPKNRPARRTFLKGAGALGAGALLGPAAFVGGRSLFGQSATAARRIDIHHHLIAPEYRKAVAAANLGGLPALSPEQSIAEMDKNGVATSLLSLAAPGLWWGNAEQSRSLARGINEYGAKMVRDFPGRFGLMATLPLLDVDASLKEIAYAFDTLKCDGMGLITSYDDRYLGDAIFAPVWEELNRRKAVVYTHPSQPACCSKMKDEVAVGTIEYATDTTRTIASIVFSGTAARYPDIRWIFSHGGGTVPFLLSRFVREEAGMKEKEKRLPRGMLYELKKFYYEIAQANHPGALDALLRLVPPSQMLFGTDYPYRPTSDATEGLAAHGFSPADLRAIERDNTLRLLPGIKG
jgi:predicted TIM-barrel fold metal-dependent hydrolase